MSQIIIDRLKENVSKEAHIYLKNGFHFFGKISNCDDQYLELFDYKTTDIKLLLIEEIRQVDIKDVRGKGVGE